MKKVLATAGILIVLLGVIGVPVYRHTCLHQDLTIVSVYAPSDHCEEVACVVEPVVSSCCEKESAIQEVNGNCCADEISDIRLHLSYFEEFVVKWQLVLPDVISNTTYLIADNRAIIKKSMGIVQSHAPPLKVHQYLPLICIWRL